MHDVVVFNAVIAGEPNVLPVGPLSVVSALEAAGFDVGFRDYQTWRFDGPRLAPESFLRFLTEVDAPVMAISAMSGNLPTVLGAVRELKRREPDRIVVLGGPGPSDTPVEILESFPVDFIVRGEGEETAVELMRAMRAGEDPAGVLGLAYRSNGEIRLTPDRPRITDLDSLPAPAYHKVDFEDYSGGLHVMTSRGCPYGCKFCSTRSIWGKTVTYRSIPSVVREIESVRDRITWICFADDNLALRAGRVVELCRMLKEFGTRIPWMTYGRINLTTEEMLREMADSGCEEVFFGIESGSDRVLEELGKGFKIGQTREVLAMAAKYVQQVNTSYIWGYPFETIDDLCDTVLAIGENERMDGVTPHFYLLGPFVKTPLFERYSGSLRFDPEFIPNVGSVPVRERISDHPELLEIVRDHPRICAPYYHYDHPELPEKRRIIDALRARNPGVSRKPVGPPARAQSRR